jgi:predicted amidohydrolase
VKVTPRGRSIPAYAFNKGAGIMARLASLFLVLTLAGTGDGTTKAPGGIEAPDGWRTESPRAELAPEFRVERSGGATPLHPYILVQAGRGNPSVDGRWIRSVPVKEGTFYQFAVEYQAKQVASPERSVLARVVWRDARGKQVEMPEYPVTSPHQAPDGWAMLTGTYRAPEKAASARLELHLRWAAQGQVRWRTADLKAAAPPAARPVRLATVNHRPQGTHSSQENLEQFAALVSEAAGRRPDIVCLPEGITVVGNGKSYAEAAEPIPGPSTRFLGELARKHHVYLVAGLYEREGTAVYNTSVLLGRDGSLTGKYRKVCLPREEIDGGITPGHSYPVFDTDFGRIGMMICWDVHFPEVARALAARGAEVILMPIWGGNETLARARAIENQLYLVASGYDFKSAIFDKDGSPLALATSDPSVLMAEVDLNERRLWPSLGDWRARIWREGPERAENGR